MFSALQDVRIQRVLNLTDDTQWRGDLERLLAGDVTLTRRSAGESSIEGVQRLLIFLGYSTTASGAFSIDGDFGRGSNRAVAQFQHEHGLNPEISRAILCYECSWQNASRHIVSVPDALITAEHLETMVNTAVTAIDSNQVMCGSFDEAIFHLDALHHRRVLSCRRIFERYGDLVTAAVDRLAEERGLEVQREWVLAIIKLETGGVVRPRFEQHLLTRFNKAHPETDFRELRHRAMSFGLGQILGCNYRKVGAPSAQAMFTSPLDDQVLFVCRFLATKRDIVAVLEPSDTDFRTIARYYNGPGYATHHYHEKLARWFREFKQILS